MGAHDLYHSGYVSRLYIGNGAFMMMDGLDQQCGGELAWKLVRCTKSGDVGFQAAGCM